MAWADEQVALLRAGKLADTDTQHIANEVKDAGKSARRELLIRMIVLVAHLLKWSAQPDRRSKSREKTVAYQRGEVLDHLADVASLRSSLSDPERAGRVWLKAVALAGAETGLETSDFPAVSPGTVEQVLSRDFLPS